MVKKLIFIFLLALIPLALADAPPAIPHQFYGSVDYLGEPLDGFTLVAEVNGYQFSSDIISGRYGSTPFLITSQEAVEIIFSINGYEIGTHEFNSGGYTELDFEVDSSIDLNPEPEPQPDTSGGGSPGGSGGGGRASFSGTVLTEEYKSVGQLNIGRGKSFKLNDVDHTIMLDRFIGDDSVQITIKSDPITITLGVGEETTVDIEPESDYLLNIKLESISGNKADILLKQIVRPIEETTKEAEITETEGSDLGNQITGAMVGFNELSIGYKAAASLFLIFIVFSGFVIYKKKIWLRFLRK